MGDHAPSSPALALHPRERSWSLLSTGTNAMVPFTNATQWSISTRPQIRAFKTELKTELETELKTEKSQKYQVDMGISKSCDVMNGTSLLCTQGKLRIGTVRPHVPRAHTVKSKPVHDLLAKFCEEHNVLCVNSPAPNKYSYSRRD